MTDVTQDTAAGFDALKGLGTAAAVTLCVVQQIDEYAPQMLFIKHDMARWRVELQHQLTRRRCLALPFLANQGDLRIQCERLTRVGAIALLYAGDIENFLGDAGQTVGILADDAA